MNKPVVLSPIALEEIASSDIVIRLWSETEFSASKTPWNDLLRRSSADPLFLSWEWVHSWYNQFVDKSESSLRIIAAYDKKNQLIGIAPLYLGVAYTKNFVRTRRLQLLGSAWNNAKVMRSEYLEFITDSDHAPSVIKVIFNAICKMADWNELILTDIKAHSLTYALLSTLTENINQYSRPIEKFNSYHVDTSGCFAAYLSSLGPNTRRKMFHQRAKLQRLGQVEYVSHCPKSLDELFESLDLLHFVRWQKTAFREKKKAFNRRFAELMQSRGALNFSMILFDGKPISIHYNFIVDNTEYNIQSGFDEFFHPQLSIGYLHFGYDIEAAFRSNISKYDLLIGPGKHCQFKKFLTEMKTPCLNIQLFRGGISNLFFKAYDRLKNSSIDR